MSEQKANLIPAVEKTVSLLEALSVSDTGMSQAKLCKDLGIPQSTCYRILQTLLEHGWIQRCEGSLFDLAPKMLSVTEKLNDFARRFERLQPELDKLSKVSDLSCKLSIWLGNDQVTVLRAESPRPLAVSGKTGVKFPVVEGSVGAALVMGCSDKEIEKLATGCKADIIEKNNPELVKQRINKINKCGYCLNEGSTRWNVRAMSAPVMNKKGNVEAALTLLGFDQDFPEDKMQDLSEKLTAAAQACAKLLAGY